MATPRATARALRTLGGKSYSVEASFVKWLPSADGPERVSLVAPYCAALVHVAYMRDRSAHGEVAGEAEEERHAEEGAGAAGSGSHRLSPPLRLVVPLPRASDVAPSTLDSAARTRATAAMRRRLYAFLAPRAPRTTLGELHELCAAVEADGSATTVGGDPNGALDALARKHGVRRVDLDPWARRAMWQSLVRLFRRCDGATLLSEVDELVALHEHSAAQLFASLRKRYGDDGADNASGRDAAADAAALADPATWRRAHVVRDRLGAFLRAHDESATVDDLEALLVLSLRDTRAAFDALRARHGIDAGAVPSLGAADDGALRHGGDIDTDVVWLRTWLHDAYFAFSIAHDPALTCKGLRERVELHLRTVLAPLIDPDSPVLAGRPALDALADRLCAPEARDDAVLSVEEKGGAESAGEAAKGHEGEAVEGGAASPLVGKRVLWSLPRLRLRLHSMYRRCAPAKSAATVDALVERYAHVPSKLLEAVAKKFGAAKVSALDAGVRPNAQRAVNVARAAAERASAAAAALSTLSSSSGEFNLGPPPAPSARGALSEVLDQISLTATRARSGERRPGIRFAVRRQASKLGADVVVLGVFLQTCFDDPAAEATQRALLVNVQHLESCSEYELAIPPSTGNFDELSLVYSLRYVNRTGAGSWLDTKLIKTLEFCPLSLVAPPRLALGDDAEAAAPGAEGAPPSSVDPFLRERLRRRVTDFFRAFDPKRSLRDVEQLVLLYQSKRPALLRTLCAHYDAPEIADIGARERMWRRLWSFYCENDVTKSVGAVDDIVARYHDKQSKLWATMCRKYDLDDVPDPEGCAELRRRLLCFFNSGGGRGVGEAEKTVEAIEVLVDRYNTKRSLLWKTFRSNYGIVPPHPPLRTGDEPSARRAMRLEHWLYAQHRKHAPNTTVIALFKLHAFLLSAVRAAEDAAPHDELVDDELFLDAEQRAALCSSLGLSVETHDVFDPPFERDGYSINLVRQRAVAFFRARSLTARTVAAVEEIATRYAAPIDRARFEANLRAIPVPPGEDDTGDADATPGRHAAARCSVPDPINTRRLRERLCAFYTQYDATKTLREIDALVEKCGAAPPHADAVGALFASLAEMFSLDDGTMPYAPLCASLPLPALSAAALKGEAELMREERATRLAALAARLEVLLKEARHVDARANNRADAQLLAESFIGREDDLLAHLRDAMGFSESSIARELRLPHGAPAVGAAAAAAVTAGGGGGTMRVLTTYNLAALHPVLQWRVYHEAVAVGRQRVIVTVFVAAAAPTSTASSAGRQGMIDTVRILMRDPKTNSQALLLLGASGAPFDAGSACDPLMPRVDVDALVGNVRVSVPALLRLLRWVPASRSGALTPARIEIIGHEARWSGEERAALDGTRAARDDTLRVALASPSPSPRATKDLRERHVATLAERLYHMRTARRRALALETRAAAYARYVATCAARRSRMPIAAAAMEWQRAAKLLHRRTLIRSIRRKHERGVVELGFQAWISKTASRLALKQFARVWANARVAFSSWHSFALRIRIKKVASRAKSTPFALQRWFTRVGRRRYQRSFISAIRARRTHADEFAIIDATWFRRTARKMIHCAFFADLKRWVAACFFQAAAGHMILHADVVKLRNAKLQRERLKVAAGAWYREKARRLRFRALLESIRLSVRTRDARQRATARLVQDMNRALCIAPPGDVLRYATLFARGALERAIEATEKDGGPEQAQTVEHGESAHSLSVRIGDVSAGNARLDAANRTGRFHELRQLRAARALQQFARIFTKARSENSVAFVGEKRFVARYGGASALGAMDTRTVYARMIETTLRRRRRAMEIAWVGARAGYVEQRLFSAKLVQRWARAMLYARRSSRDSRMVRKVFAQRVVTPPRADNGPKRCPLGARCATLMLGTCELFHPLEEIDAAMALGMTAGGIERLSETK